jgi:K+-transporting ATPase c subunit
MKQLIIALRVTLVFAVLTGVAYPLLVTGLAKAMFPHQADGSLIPQGGKIVGSELIGQRFTGRSTSRAVLRPPVTTAWRRAGPILAPLIST